MYNTLKFIYVIIPTIVLPKFLVTFDIVNGQSSDYDKVHQVVKSNYPTNFSGYICLRSLSTTYAIKSSLSVEKIKNIFRDSISKSVRVIVVKYVEITGLLLTVDVNFLNENEYL